MKGLTGVTNEDLKQIGISNRVIQIIIAVATSVIAACAISTVMFMIDVRSSLPEMKRNLDKVDQAIPIIQQGINDLRADQKVIKSEQANMKEQIDDLKQEVRKK